MEIRRKIKSLFVNQYKEIQIIVQLADLLEWLLLQIVLILFQRQPMEALFFIHDLRRAINFISHVSLKQKTNPNMLFVLQVSMENISQETIWFT